MSQIREKETMLIVKDPGTKTETRRRVSIRVDQPDQSHLTIPETIAGSSSNETLTGKFDFTQKSPHAYISSSSLATYGYL